jgi:histidinol-phosphate aminotransferase
MASNENPLGASPVVRRALEEAAEIAYRYPAAGTPKLSAAVAEHLGVDPARVVCGNGSDEIIDLLIRVKARPGVDNIAAFRPCFAMYELQARLCGVQFRQAPLGEDFAFDFEALLSVVDQDTALCFVTSPDNPSGRAAGAEELARFARALPPQCLLVIDEAYAEFSGDEEKFSLISRLDELENVAILRTFSKMYGLAGLRVGYGVLPPWLADLIMRVKLPFSVSLPAEAGALAALKDRDFARMTIETVAEGREFLRRELEALGCRVLPSRANFLLFYLPASAMLSADAVHEALLRRGLILRPLTSYGLPDALRVSVGNGEENRELVRALEEILGNG